MGGCWRHLERRLASREYLRPLGPQSWSSDLLKADSCSSLKSHLQTRANAPQSRVVDDRRAIYELVDMQPRGRVINDHDRINYEGDPAFGSVSSTPSPVRPRSLAVSWCGLSE